jgi:hypothetical protein
MLSVVKARWAGLALILVAPTLIGCQQQPLGMTVGGKPCGINLHASPRSVHPGGQVTIRRAPGCDKDDARRMTVRLSSRNTAARPIGTATLGPDGAVTGTVVIPSGTLRGQYFLDLNEKMGCDDTASCAGHPVSVALRVR